MSEGTTDYYAYSLEGKPPSEWQRLEEHLRGKAKLAARFAADFGCSEWGYLAGLWHEVTISAPEVIDGLCRSPPHKRNRMYL